MLQTGSGLTVRITSSVTVHPLVVSTVNRRVAEGEVTVAVVLRLSAAAMEAVPDTTDHVVEVIVSPGLGVAVPDKANSAVVVLEQTDWSGPALATPRVRLTCSGEMKSTMVAVAAWDTFVLTMTVRIPRLKQGSKLPRSAVRSTAASEKVFLR